MALFHSQMRRHMKPILLPQVQIAADINETVHKTFIYHIGDMQCDETLELMPTKGICRTLPFSVISLSDSIA